MPDKLDYWKNDLLGRNEDAQLLHTFLVRRMEERKALGQTGSYVLNLDAGWGQGKTFFLAGFNELLKSEGHRVVLVNAWEDDYAEDPLLSVVSAIEKTFPEGKPAEAARSVAAVGAKIAAVGLKHGAKALLTKVVGSDGAKQIIEAGGALAKGGVDAVGELLDASTDAMGKVLLSQFAEGKAAVSDFRNKLSELVQASEDDPPLFILIDELDRCRPSYAITLLERVKHLFEVDGVVFVIATDTEQLRHSIAAVYGSEFDGKGYLLRFFDRTYKFAIPDNSSFIEKLLTDSQIGQGLLASPPNDQHLAFITSAAHHFSLTLREIERCFDILRSFLTMWSPQQPKVQLAYLMPLIIAYCRDDKRLFAPLAKFAANTSLLKETEANRVTFIFDTADDHGRPTGREGRNLVELLVEFQDIGRRPITELMQMDRVYGGMSGWIRQQLVQEAYAARGRQDNTSLHEYPELIRKVARLSKEGD